MNKNKSDIMEVVKQENENKVKQNGVAVLEDNLKITENDINNLGFVFEWALATSIRDRQKMASLLTFEKSLIDKLKEVIRKY